MTCPRCEVLPIVYVRKGSPLGLGEKSLEELRSLIKT